jgi:ankyrin repeat protein
MIHLFLFIASFTGHIEVVKELLNRGANIEEKDNDGYTPLIWGIFLNYSIILNDSFIFIYSFLYWPH